jgi:hypothetical protein
MLKIWKQTWKKEDSARRPNSEHNSDAQGSPLSGTSSGGSPVTSTATVPPSTGDASTGPVLPRGRLENTKRSRVDDSAEPSVILEAADRPHKKTKIQEDASPANDTLANHLPEVIESDPVTRPATSPQSRATFEEKLLYQAKSENSEFRKLTKWKITFK